MLLGIVLDYCLILIPSTWPSRVWICVDPKLIPIHFVIKFRSILFQVLKPKKYNMGYLNLRPNPLIRGFWVSFSLTLLPHEGYYFLISPWTTMSFTLQYHIALQSMLRHHPTPLWLPLLLLVTVSTHHHHYPLHHNLHFLNTRTPRGNSSSSTNTHTIMLALTSSRSWHQSIIHSQAIDSD